MNLKTLTINKTLKDFRALFHLGSYHIMQEMLNTKSLKRFMLEEVIGHQNSIISKNL